MPNLKTGTTDPILPKSPFKLLLCDIDGTLLPNNSLDLPSRSVTQALKDAGQVLMTGLITARQPQKSLYLVKHLQINSLSILSNGAQIYDPQDSKMIIERILDPKTVVQIGKLLESDKIDFWIQDDGIDCRFTSQYQPRKPFVIVAHNVSLGTETKIIAQIKKFPKVTAYRGHTHSDGTYDVFITDQFATKEHALNYLMEILNLKKEKVMAIGDGPNDKIFLERVGLAVAMGNSAPETAVVARYQVTDVEHDGVTQAIERFIFKNP